METWNGWLRLWLVLSLLLGVPMALIGHSAADQTFVSVPFSDSERHRPQAEMNSIFWARAGDEARKAHCALETVKLDTTLSYTGSSYWVSCDYAASYRFRQTLLFGAAPGILLWLVGFAVAWIRRGFKGSGKRAA